MGSTGPEKPSGGDQAKPVDPRLAEFAGALTELRTDCDNLETQEAAARAAWKATQVPLEEQ